MKLSQLILTDFGKKLDDAAGQRVKKTTYRRKTRRQAGVTLVGIPNKIAKTMGR